MTIFTLNQDLLEFSRISEERTFWFILVMTVKGLIVWSTCEWCLNQLGETGGEDVMV